MLHEACVRGPGSVEIELPTHRFVRSSFFSSVIDPMSGLGASPVLHTSRPKFTVGTTDSVYQLARTDWYDAR